VDLSYSLLYNKLYDKQQVGQLVAQQVHNKSQLVEVMESDTNRTMNGVFRQIQFTHEYTTRDYLSTTVALH